jgi:predicted membrane protein
MMVPPRRFVTAQLVIGLVVLALGTVMLLDNLGHPVGRLALQYWPAVLVFVGIAKILQARNTPAAIGGGLFIFAGAWLLATRLGFIEQSFWRVLRTYWPLILVAVGLSTMWRAFSRRQADERGLVDARDTISSAAFLGGLKRVNASQSFKGGEATAVMGGVVLDLRKAKIAGEAVLDVFAMWGGVELQVPEEWAIDLRITPLLGGVDDKTRPVTDPSAPRFVLRGTVLMGGVEIKN